MWLLASYIPIHHYTLLCVIHFRGICEHEEVYWLIENLIPHLSKAYLHVFNKACNNDTLFTRFDEDPQEKSIKAREFFGLRDFYRYFTSLFHYLDAA